MRRIRGLSRGTSPAIAESVQCGRCARSVRGFPGGAIPIVAEEAGAGQKPLSERENVGSLDVSMPSESESSAQGAAIHQQHRSRDEAARFTR